MYIDEQLSSYSFLRGEKINIKILFPNPLTTQLNNLTLNEVKRRYLRAGWRKVKISKDKGRLYCIYLKLKNRA